MTVGQNSMCKCQSGHYTAQPTLLTCEKCHKTCTNCSGPTATSCLGCVDKSTLLVRTGSDSQFCQCREGYFLNSANGMECVSCKS